VELEGPGEGAAVRSWANREPDHAGLSRSGYTTKVSGGRSVTSTRAAGWYARHNLNPKGLMQPDEEGQFPTGLRITEAIRGGRSLAVAARFDERNSASWLRGR